MEQKTFEAGKNAKDLGIDLNREFIIIITEDSRNPKGTLVKLREEDGSVCPYFDRSDGSTEYLCISWKRLAYADETTKSKSNKTKETTMPTESPTFKVRLQNADLKGTDKIMVDAGLENPAGSPTAEGEELMKDFLYRQNREALSKEVEVLLKEDAKEAKK